MLDLSACIHCASKDILSSYPKFAHLILPVNRNDVLWYSHLKFQQISIIRVVCGSFSRLHIINGDEYKYIDFSHAYSWSSYYRYLYKGCICSVKYFLNGNKICYIERGIKWTRGYSYQCPNNLVETIVKLTYQKERLLRLVQN